MPGRGGSASTAVSPAEAGPFRLSDLRCDCGSDAIRGVLPGQDGAAEVRDLSGNVLLARVRKRAAKALCVTCWAHRYGGPVAQQGEAV